MADKVDFKRSLPSYRGKVGRFDVVDLATTAYLMIDGEGDPNTSAAFAAATAALYPIAYALKFASKTDLGRDYVVPPLEGLWWAEDMDAFTSARDKNRWSWTLMLMVPEWLGGDAVEEATRSARRRNPEVPIDTVRFSDLDEGTCFQTLHVGSFDDEGPVLQRMHHEVIPAAGFALTGTHHEIYLSDPRRSAPSRQRTILRQPVRPI